MARLYECSACLFGVGRESVFRSKATGAYYCIDTEACDRRRQNKLTNEEIFQLSGQLLKGLSLGDRKAAVRDRGVTREGTSTGKKAS